MASLKNRLNRLRELGLMKATELEPGAERAVLSRKPVQELRRPVADGGSATFLDGWEQLSAHLFTRTKETGYALETEGPHVATPVAPLWPSLSPEGRVRSFERLCFLDFETTGLSGGTGTVAFLAALGFFEGRDFLVRQYFIDDFPAEPGFVREIAEFLSSRPLVVTYNGASFDIPLLRSRCVMNGQRLCPIEHFDALHSVRRLYRSRLPSCALKEMERCLFGIERIDDVPGALIPQIWLDYVKSGWRLDAPRRARLEGVAAHNVQDVVSLARLFIRLAELMDEPGRRWRRAGADGHALARTLAREGRLDEAIAVLEDVGGEGSDASLRSLGRMYRRTGRQEEYARTVLSMDDQSYIGRLEKAKLFEHVVRDFKAALDCAKAALRLLPDEPASARRYSGRLGAGQSVSAEGLSRRRKGLEEDLLKRIRRLEKKLEAKPIPRRLP